MIIEMEGLLSDENLCDRVIKYFQDSNKRSWWQDADFFKGRTICPDEIEDFQIKKELKILQHKVIQEAYCQYKEYLFPEFWDIVHWSPDMSMEPHVDNALSFDKQRDYTSVFYLNDDYSGGETYLPHHNYVCIPKKGKLVIFPSNYSHGVNKVEKKSRYVLVMWFTKDEKYLRQ